VDRFADADADHSDLRPSSETLADDRDARAALDRERQRRKVMVTVLLDELDSESGCDPTGRRGDLAGLHEEYLRRAELVGEHRRALMEIAAALARLETGRYGTCERCQRAISRERLRATPEVRLCMTCHHSLLVDQGPIPERLAPIEVRPGRSSHCTRADDRGDG
jgi:DnaK suppressor protein